MRKIKTNLGEIIESKGLRYNWVAEKIGCTKSQITNWSSNDAHGHAKSTPNVKYVLRLEKLLGVSVSEMFEEVE